MHPNRVARPFYREGCVYEEKVDGYRMAAVKSDDHVSLISRNGVHHTKRFPELVKALAALEPEDFILDGEVAVYDETLISRFEWLRRRPKDEPSTLPVYMAFDVLKLDGLDLRGEPLKERRRVLEGLVAGERMILPVQNELLDGGAGNGAHFIRVHLVPFFGERPVNTVTRSDVQDFIASRRAVGGSVRGKAIADSTLKMNLPGLRLIFDYAVEKGWLASNPMRGVRLWRPMPRVEEPDPFTRKELAAIVAASESISAPLGVMLQCWAQSGMRSGEIRGLQHGDWTPDTGEVTIRRTRSHQRTGPPKTLQSARPAMLTHPVCEPVSAWQPSATAASWSVLERLSRVRPLDDHAPLFPSLADPTQPMEERQLHRLWRRVLLRAKVRARPPETLRRSFVSGMLSRGAPLLLVARQTGHSPVVLLKHYARWLPQEQPGATPAQPVRRRPSAK
jgi:integrase